MTVIKEAKIRIDSVIENLGDGGLPEGDAERNAVEADGYLNFKDGDATLTYSEQAEGERVDSEVRVEGDEITVIRHGAVESEMRFAEGRTHRSLYRVGPYAFDAEVRTRRIRRELTADGGRIELYYNMKIGGAEKSARMKIWISTDSSRK